MSKGKVMRSNWQDVVTVSFLSSTRGLSLPAKSSSMEEKEEVVMVEMEELEDTCCVYDSTS